MAIPVKRPCPCGYTGLDGKGKCHKFLVEPIIDTAENSVYEEEADAIIETYRDAERLRFLLANPVVCATLQFQQAHKRRAWIDDQMKTPWRKKPK